MLEIQILQHQNQHVYKIEISAHQNQAKSGWAHPTRSLSWVKLDRSGAKRYQLYAGGHNNLKPKIFDSPLFSRLSFQIQQEAAWAELNKKPVSPSITYDYLKQISAYPSSSLSKNAEL